MVLAVAALAALLLTAAPATADRACPAPPAAARLVRAGDRAVSAPVLPLGTDVTAALLPTPRVAYPVPPAKPGATGTSGGLFAFAVPAAGRYRVALGSGVWVDVLSGTTPVASAAHGHGPECSGVRKPVDFDLTPGRHLLQVAGAAAATLRLTVSRAP